MPHSAKIYWSLDQLLERSCNNANSIRFHVRLWKRHFKKRGNTPLIIKCAICSGKQRKNDIKHGIWKISTRVSKREIEEELE